MKFVEEVSLISLIFIEVESKKRKDNKMVIQKETLCYLSMDKGNQTNVPCYLKFMRIGINVVFL